MTLFHAETLRPKATIYILLRLCIFYVEKQVDQLKFGINFLLLPFPSNAASVFAGVLSGPKRSVVHISLDRFPAKTTFVFMGKGNLPNPFSPPLKFTVAFYNLFNQSSIISPIGCSVSFILKKKGTQSLRNSPPRRVLQSPTSVCSPSNFPRSGKGIYSSPLCCLLQSYFITSGP